jgi:hypothetical protein
MYDSLELETIQIQGKAIGCMRERVEPSIPKKAITQR